MKKWQLIVLIIAVAVFSAGVGAYAATNYGTQSDPLITLSYINETLKPTMINNFDSQAEKAMEMLENRFTSDLATATGSFRAVTVSKGQTVTGGEGTEILLHTGSGTATGTLVDLTTGALLKTGGGLALDHLYICPAAGAGVSCTANSSLMVRGGSSVS